MIQTKTIAMILVLAIATVGAIGIGIGTAVQSAEAATQNDNNQVNNNIQGAISNCHPGFPNSVCGENPQGNQP